MNRYDRKQHGLRSFSCSGPHVWNALPYSVRHCSHFFSFKASLKTYFFSLTKMKTLRISSGDQYVELRASGVLSVMSDILVTPNTNAGRSTRIKRQWHRRFIIIIIDRFYIALFSAVELAELAGISNRKFMLLRIIPVLSTRQINFD